MLFNSTEFIFIFLPITFIVYFLLNKLKLVKIATGWLVLASLYFYSYWKLDYLPIILFSMIFNYAIGYTLSNEKKLKINRKMLMIFGIIGNILLLGYYKYFDFLIQNINMFFHQNFNYMYIVLPLGISFFTFQQIAYIVDSYEGKTKEYDFLTYALFVTFFPQLIAGPIVHHKEMIPQFENLRNRFINFKNISKGILIFSIGLFKKVIIADFMAKCAGVGFSTSEALSFTEAWITILSYTFQIFFDFSGYTDMARGIGYMFNIELPQNFDNPYISKDIQEFWRRWHMTLSRFLKDYVYIPLGGNRCGNFKTYRNLFLTFLIGGIWHGANWTFIIWGVLHGIGVVINRIYKQFKIDVPNPVIWFITFLYVNITWVYFGANHISTANNILLKAFNPLLFDMPRIYFPTIRFKNSGNILDFWIIIIIPVLIFFIFNDTFRRLIDEFKPKLKYSVFIAIIFLIVILQLIKPDYTSPFIYFNF